MFTLFTTNTIHEYRHNISAIPMLIHDMIIGEICKFISYVLRTWKETYVMANLTRDFFIALSNNELLNKSAKKWGYNLGAEQFVAGTDIDGVINSVKKLNDKGIACTVDNLGEFVTEKSESTKAKENILSLIERIHTENVSCHVSVKLTQLGLDIDESFCLENMKEIVSKASKYDIFVNIDTENYDHYAPTMRVFDELLKSYSNVGTVIQSYFYHAEADVDKYKHIRLRIVKGAYKESEDVAFQTTEEIDRNFIRLVKKRLNGDAFTSIATHDHHIINEVKQFIIDQGIDKTKFEFQMLYGFRTEMQEALANEGYLFCTYLPFGDDWYGYFMRRLAERPQNINLVLKDKLYTSDNKLKKTPIIVAAASVLVACLLFFRRKN